MMNLTRRFFKRGSINMEMMKMAVWCPRLSICTYYFDYGDGRPLSHTYDDKPRSWKSYC
jgi:hypothetical protein